MIVFGLPLAPYSKELVEEVDELVVGGGIARALQPFQNGGLQTGSLLPFGEEDDGRDQPHIVRVVLVECTLLFVFQKGLELRVLEEALFDGSEFV